MPFEPTNTSLDFINTEKLFGAQNYNPAPLVAARAKKWHIWDVDGRKYTDLVSAYSAVSLGHSNKKILKALKKQAKTLAVTSRAIHNDILPAYLETLCATISYDKALPMNSGAEAVETALKIARKWGEKIKGVASGAGKIIACQNNFHGRTLAIISMSTEPQYKDGFGPYLPGIEIVPYGDTAALTVALEDPNVVAFLVEPIQGEAGIVVPPEGYLSQTYEVCRKQNVLFIADEIQTGLTRTGALLCCDHEGVVPDIVILGKALGGGVLPVSAVLTRDEIMAVITPGDHGSTFGGNPLACAVAIEALRQLKSPKLTEHVQSLGQKALSYLTDNLSKYPEIVKNVRGKGLFIGIELQPGLKAKKLVQTMLEEGVLIKDTHESVIRIAPPLIISEKALFHALNKLVTVLPATYCN